MAFIPDSALDEYDDIAPASQLGYSFICRHRNHTTGFSAKTLKDCAEKYKWSRATYFNVQKELLNGWIVEIDGKLLPVKGDFSPVNKSKFLDSFISEQSKKIDQESKNLDKKSKNLDSYNKEYQPLPAIPANERDSAGEPFEVFEEAENLANDSVGKALEVALSWIQSHKKLSRKNFPISEWTDLIAALVPEGINSTGKFKDFYLWVENLDWVDTVSPNLMRSQIEKYKRREEIGAKKQNAGINQNGKPKFRPDQVAHRKSDADVLAELGIS